MQGDDDVVAAVFLLDLLQLLLFRLVAILVLCGQGGRHDARVAIVSRGLAVLFTWLWPVAGIGIRRVPFRGTVFVGCWC